MKNPSFLTRLAMAGIASGMLALTQCGKAEKARESSGAVPDKGAAGNAAEAVPADTARGDRHGCKGLNDCKGQGGCAVNEGTLKELAAKAGIPEEKAGKAHGCKGRNECKGLGGCNM